VALDDHIVDLGPMTLVTVDEGYAAVTQNNGIRAVSEAIQAQGGKDAMGQRIAEMYISQMSEMAKHSKMMIVPEAPTDVSGVITSAFGLAGAVSKAVGAQ